MPRKLRELRSALRKAGFRLVEGKGSHENWNHAERPIPFTLSGHDGDDAQRYQEKLVRDALRDVGERLR